MTDNMKSNAAFEFSGFEMLLAGVLISNISNALRMSAKGGLFRRFTDDQWLETVMVRKVQFISIEREVYLA